MNKNYEMTSSNYFNTFLNTKIKKCLINDEKTKMRWLVDKQWYEISTYGDYCSNSWFEHCDNASALQNSTLKEFEDYSGEDIESGDFDIIKINMLKFKTTKGYCTIEFRNSSNGYYSGWCEFSLVNDSGENCFKALEDF